MKNLFSEKEKSKSAELAKDYFAARGESIARELDGLGDKLVAIYGKLQEATIRQHHAERMTLIKERDSLEGQRSNLHGERNRRIEEKKFALISFNKPLVERAKNYLTEQARELDTMKSFEGTGEESWDNFGGRLTKIKTNLPAIVNLQLRLAEAYRKINFGFVGTLADVEKIVADAVVEVNKPSDLPFQILSLFEHELLTIQLQFPGKGGLKTSEDYKMNSCEGYASMCRAFDVFSAPRSLSFGGR